MLPPPRATRGSAPPLHHYFPTPAAPRPPRLHDRVEILWEDRGVYFRGTLAHRVARKGNTRLFRVRYDDGDEQDLDLDDFHWRFIDDRRRRTPVDPDPRPAVDALEFIPDRSESVSALSDPQRPPPAAAADAAAAAAAVTDADVSASTRAPAESSLCDTGAARACTAAAAVVVGVSPVSITQRAASPKPLLLGACVKAGRRTGFVLPPPRPLGTGGKDWKRRVMEKFLRQEMMHND